MRIKFRFFSIAVGRITNDLFCISNEIDCKSLIAFYFHIEYAMPAAGLWNWQVRALGVVSVFFSPYRIRRDFPLPVGCIARQKCQRKLSLDESIGNVLNEIVKILIENRRTYIND